MRGTLRAELAEAVTEILEQASGGKVRLGEATDLGGSNRSEVWRLQLTKKPEGVPSSVIVKQAHATGEEVYDPETPTMPALTLFNEWASLQFLGEVFADAPLAPTFYGGDRELGFFISEDLGSGKRLDTFLLDKDAEAAERALLEYASLQGRMHAGTAKHLKEFETRRNALGPRDFDSDPFYKYDWLASTLKQICETLDVSLMRGTLTDLAELQKNLLENKPFPAFTQSDCCPDNCVWVGDKLRLLDFEGGGAKPALLDGVYGRMLFPTCWCASQIPLEIITKMETDYRTELKRGFSQATHDKHFYPAVVEACVFWVLSNLNLLFADVVEKDVTMKLASVRQRLLARTQIAAEATAEYQHLEAIGKTFSRIAQKLGENWPETEKLPLFPAFA